MAFPPRLLNEGEVIAFDLRPHWWFFAKPAGVGAIVIALAVGVSRINHDGLNRFGWWLWAIGAAVWAGWTVWKLLNWIFTNFVVTSNRLVFRAGVLGKHGREIPLERVNDIAFHQSLWERIIGAGDLLIESAGEQGQQRFSDIPEPETMQQEIYKQIEAYKARTIAAHQAPAAPTATIPEQIAQLADLRDRGVLSDVEFEEKKRALLEKM
ncbi:MAG TPA: PH domain-containing protein [Acidimicrobiia bacterium]|nr:PH domain-containing protein [Acidimicrobiia bacterium]